MRSLKIIFKKSLIYVLLLPALLCTGCNRTEQTPLASTRTSAETAEKLKIVCTVFPQYDWVVQILGDVADEYELTLLLSSRMDLHNYQPSVEDIVRIQSSDLFIYVGGVSDDWVEEALDRTRNPNGIVVNLIEVLGDSTKLEDIIEGMDHAHDDDYDHDNGVDESDHDEEDREFDEHVWLSLKNAQTFCATIADALTLLDPENAEVFASNLNAYTQELSSLDDLYQEAVNTASIKTLLFGDRFPFRYLLDDYEITYYAAFPGCSAETEASFTTIIFLAGKVDELDIKKIIVTESTDKLVAETIINSSREKNQQILVLDSMQSVTPWDIQNGTTYCSIMERNLSVLVEALK